MCYNGTYYSICANNTFASIDDTIAQIVCTDLGYRDCKCTLPIINNVSVVIYPTYMENWKSYNYYYTCILYKIYMEYITCIYRIKLLVAICIAITIELKRWLILVNV